MLLRIARASFVVACALALGFTASLVSPDVPVVKADDALPIVKEGIGEYKKGNWKKAIETFDKALAQNPNDEEARKIRDEIGSELARDFIENNFRDVGLKGRYSRFGKWVMTGLGKGPYGGRQKDPENIAKYVDAYMADADTTRNMIRASSIRDTYGDYAVPYLQKNYMHSDNDDYRYRARVLLATLGAQAVNALVQCFYSAEKYDRQTAALALGDIRDARALPVLARHFQDKDEDEQVREACRSAIELIRADNPEQDKQVNNAKDLFYLQAKGMYRNNAAGRYYRNRLVGTNYQGQLPVVMSDYNRHYTVWKWVPANVGSDKMALVDQDVPLWAFPDIMAEESCLQAFELGVLQSGGNAADAFTQDAQSLLARIHMHMYTEGVNRLYNSSDSEREFIRQMLGEHGYVPNEQAFGLASLGGTKILSLALEDSLADGYPSVSVGLCDAIADQDDSSVVGKAPGASLVRALSDPDRKVNYAAARALIRLGGNINFGNNKKVEEQAVKNLQETQARSVLVIIEDQSLRNRYLADLQSLGISGTGARTLEEGADLATQGPPWDAIIIDADHVETPVFVFELPALTGAGSSGERSDPIYNLLKNDIRSKSTPILVATQGSELGSRKSDLANLNIPDDHFLVYDQDKEKADEELHTRLDGVWSQNVEDSKNKTNRMVVDMADAIATLDPNATKYDVEKLLVALSGGLRLEGRSSDARVAICNAIAKLVSGKRVGAAWLRENVMPNLLDTLTSTEAVDRPSVKGAAARALGDCYQYNKGAWDEDGYNALKGQLRLEYDLSSIADPALRENMVHEVEAARNAAGEALGKAPMTPAQVLEVAKMQAVNPHSPPPDHRAAE